MSDKEWIALSLPIRFYSHMQLHFDDGFGFRQIEPLEKKKKKI